MIISHNINPTVTLISCVTLLLKLVTQIWNINLKYPGSSQPTCRHSDCETTTNSQKEHRFRLLRLAEPGQWMVTDLILGNNQNFEILVNHPALGSRFKNSLSHIRRNNTTSNGSWCMGIQGEISGTVCVTLTWYMYIYELFIAFSLRCACAGGANLILSEMSCGTVCCVLSQWHSNCDCGTVIPDSWLYGCQLV